MFWPAHRGSDESLALHVNVLLARVEITLVVFEFFLEVGLERTLEVLGQNLLVQFEGMLDLCHVLEVDSVGDAEALHLVGVTPLLKVLLEGAAAPVARSSADFALELLAKPVQLEEPVGNRFAVPAHRQVLGVVLYSVFIVVRVLRVHLACQQLLCVQSVFFCLDLLVAAGLLLANLVLGLLKNSKENRAQLKNPSFARCDLPQAHDLALRVLLGWATVAF